MEFLSQFDLKVLHKPGKEHVVPDALSRLPSKNNITNPTSPGGLEELSHDRPEHWALTAYTGPPLPRILPLPENTSDGDQLGLGTDNSSGTTVLNIHPDFVCKLQQGYLQDPGWKRVMDVLRDNLKPHKDNQAVLPFELHKGLLWKVDGQIPRLCLPQSCLRDVLEAIHNGNHRGYDGMRARLVNFCIKNSTRVIRQYINSCPSCKANDHRRHKPYGSLQLMVGNKCPYYTITIDFILELPISSDGNDYDACLTIVDRLSKETQLVPGKTTWTAIVWGPVLVRRLLTANWGLLKILLSDRDPKFTAAMWRAIWRFLGTALIYTAAYHPATDGQTERMIQTIASALRHYVQALEEPSRWPDILPRLQFEHNNTKSASTGMAPNEVIKGFLPVSVSEVITDSPPCVSTNHKPE